MLEQGAAALAAAGHAQRQLAAAPRRVGRFGAFGFFAIRFPYAARRIVMKFPDSTAALYASASAVLNSSHSS